MKTRNRATVYCVSLCFGLVGSVAITGCGGSQTRTDPPVMSSSARSAEARLKVQQADQAVAKGDTDKAIDLYRQAIVLDRDMYVAWNNLGVVLMESGEYLDSVAAFKVASDLSPRDPRPVSNIGLAYQEMGWAKDALAHYEEALSRDAGYLEALRGHAYAEEMLGQGSLLSIERIKQALMVEKDPQWREFFERRRFRVEALLRLTNG